MKTKKVDLVVPKGIRFISEWIEFDLPKLEEKCIINKKIPGCGMTEYYLTNSYNVILASPRKILLQNKFDQHLNDVFLVKNDEEKEVEVDRELDKSILLDNSDSIISSSIYQRIQQELSNYINKRNQEQRPIKILVTYDSYHIVKDILKFLGIFESFYTMVDEFQCLLSDSKFKSDTEIGVMNSLKDVNKVHFVSATPMIDEYLDMLEEFNNLPQYIFDWESEDEFRVLKPNLKVRTMDSVGKTINPIIQKYKSQDFNRITILDINKNLKEVVSDEAIFYVNSVSHIISAIKNNSLVPEEVNILCATTDYNKKKIKTKLGKAYTIGSVPLKGVKPKMFTFCTRTVYLGADFYSECAQTFIFSDSNYDCLAVDISQDLPQILGRQRNDNNPWKNSADFYYKATSDWRKLTKEDFDNILQEKIDQSKKLLESYGLVPNENKKALAIKYEEVAKQKHYEKDYVAVTNGIPVFNNMYYVSEIMAFNIQQVDYANRFSVFNKVSKEFPENLGEISTLLENYKKLNNVISERLRFICNLYFNKNTKLDSFLQILPNDDYAKSYYYKLGPERCRACGYIIKDVRKEISISGFNQKLLQDEIYKYFHEGDRKTCKEIKTILSSVYSSLNYPKTAKATDIEEYFDTTKITTKDKTTGKTTTLIKLNKRKLY